MSLYTFNSPLSVNRVAGQLFVVDTSYLIALSDAKEDLTGAIKSFHNAALTSGTNFIANVAARQEFVKWVRKTQLLTAMVELAKADSAVDSRFRTILKSSAPSSSTTLEERHLKTRFDALYKSLVMSNNIAKLLPFFSTDVWQEVQRLEKQINVYYVNSTENIGWQNLGLTIQKYSTDVADSMIANFAFFAGANAIATTDIDYAQFVTDIDVYMPETVAKSCAAYNPQLDN